MRRNFISVLITLFVLFPLAASAKDVKIIDDGITLNARLEIAEGKSLEDGVVLMLHGTLAHHGMDTIKGLQDVLLERGINTLAISLGYKIDDRYGMYDCKQTHRHLYTDAIDELTAWVKWLEAQNVGPITLFGHSRGGAQAARYLTETPSAKIIRAVLLAPATWSQERTANGFKKNHKKELTKVLEQAEALVAKGKGAQVIEKVGFLYCPEGNATAETFVSYYRPDTRFDTPTLLTKIKVPTLVIAGSQDTVVKDIGEKISALADDEKLTFTMIEDADHFFLDLFAEDVADQIIGE
ncbi:MAG: alpha/beta hydrolase [Rhodospirillales bacterium]|nr:alpha/beta hydrolase [Rhodospirillales bacterium]